MKQKELSIRMSIYRARLASTVGRKVKNLKKSIANGGYRFLLYHISVDWASVYGTIKSPKACIPNMPLG